MIKQNLVQIISYYPPHLGGMENCAAEIAEGFAKRGENVTVFTSTSGYKGEENKNFKAKVHYLKSIEVAHTPIMFSLFYQLLRMPKQSIMHIHISQAYAPELVYLVSKMRHIPYVAHIHLDVDASGPMGFLLRPYKRIFLKRVLHAASKIICLTEGQKQLIAQKYSLPVDAIVVIPNGVGEQYFLPKKPAIVGTPTMLFVGRLAPQKNLLFLLDVLAQMKESVHLALVGEGEDREAIEAKIQELNLTNVTLYGKQSGDALRAFYQKADLFILPSLKEGVSLAMLEAMATGLPIFASFSPEISEVVTPDCGVLVKDVSKDAYAELLDKTIKDTITLRLLGESAQERARFYTWDRVLDRIQTVYLQLLS